MPTVETYGPRRNGVAPLPGARLTAAETETSQGAGLARAKAETRRAVAQVGEQVATLGVQMEARRQAEIRRQREEAKTQADQLAVIAAQNQMNAWRRTAMHDPENGALSKKGRDAFALPEQIEADFEKQAGEVMKGMATPEQRLAFERWLANERDSVNVSVMGHVQREMQVYAANEAKANIDNAVDLAITENMTDIRQGAVKLADAERNFRAIGPSLGLGPEQVDSQVRAMRTQAHQGTIAGMLARGRTQDARAYYEGVKEQVAAEQRDDIEKALKTGTVRKEAQQATERILTAGGTYEEQRAKAKEIADADVQDEVLQRIEHEHAVREAQQREAERETLRGVATTLERTKNIASIPPGVWSKLDPPQRSAFRNYVKDLIEQGDVKGDRRIWLREIEKANADPLKWAQEVNLESQIDKHSKTDFNDLVNLRQQILNGQRNKAQTVIDGFMSNTQVVNERLAVAGFDSNPKAGTPEAKARWDMLAEVDREVQRQQAQSGKKLSNEEIRQITDSMLIDVVTQKGEGIFSRALVPGHSASIYDQTQKRGAVLASIPADKRAQIEESLRKRKRDVTPESVVDLWLTYQRQQSGQ